MVANKIMKMIKIKYLSVFGARSVARLLRPRILSTAISRLSNMIQSTSINKNRLLINKQPSVVLCKKTCASGRYAVTYAQVNASKMVFTNPALRKKANLFKGNSGTE